jgi:predicted dehydrogenase
MVKRNTTGHRNSKHPGLVRYAVVGLGHIAQVAVLPAFGHARRNSRLVALVSDDAAKRMQVAEQYGVQQMYRYDEFEACLEHVDAVYIALPNSQHADYTIRAARAGVHVLVEKPMAVTVRECQRMVETCARHRAKLMVAYRLHFEDINLRAVDLVQKGRIGEPKFFSSSFSMTVRRGDIRTRRAMGGGSLYDLGVYCINAARYLFRADPYEVMAVSTHGGGAKLAEIDESTSAILRFDRDRVASFTTSFNAADVADYRIVGTKGHLHVERAYEYATGPRYTLTVDGRTERRAAPKRDQFAPELLHFSACILDDRQPEPSGEEGMQDVRIVEALYKSAATGRAVRLRPFRDTHHPGLRQRILRPGIRKPRLVEVQSASED